MRVVTLPDGTSETRRVSVRTEEWELAFALQREAEWLDARWRELWAQGR